MVLLQDRGTTPECDDLPVGAIVGAVLPEAFVVTETKSRLVATLAGSFATARGHRLRAGDAAATVVALRAALR